MPLRTWNNRRDAALSACVAKGMSRSQAADVINDQFGSSFTRSAVSGRMSRLGLIARSTSPGPPRALTARRPEAKARPRVVAECFPVSLVDLQYHHCRAVLEQRCADGLAMYCGASRVDDSSYCAAHHEAYHTRRMAR
jgi:hypothetical protein